MILIQIVGILEPVICSPPVWTVIVFRMVSRKAYGFRFRQRMWAIQEAKMLNLRRQNQKHIHSFKSVMKNIKHGPFMLEYFIGFSRNGHIKNKNHSLEIPSM